MHKRLSINVKIPGISSTLNFLIPRDMVIANAIEMVLQIIADEYRGVSISQPERFFFIQATTSQVLDRNATMGQLGFHDGETVILI